MAAISDNELVERYEGVRLDHTNKHFYRGLLDRELRLSRCADCGWWHHRPKPICPRCWSKNVVATPVSGRGTIHLAIFLHQGPPADGVDYAGRAAPGGHGGARGAGGSAVHEHRGRRVERRHRDRCARRAHLDRARRPAVPRVRAAPDARVIGDANPAKDQVAFASAATTGFRRDTRRRHARRRSRSTRASPRSRTRGSTRPRSTVSSAPNPHVHPVVARHPAPHVLERRRASRSSPRSPNAMDAVVHRRGRRRPRVPLACTATRCSRARRPTTRSAGMGFGGWRRATASGPTASAARSATPRGRAGTSTSTSASRETFGYIAINDRSNAARNPAAALRDPITMDDYLAARMIRWPLCLLDMDVPVDGADAFIITTAERARDLALKPVLIHACTQGMIAQNEEDQTPEPARPRAARRARVAEGEERHLDRRHRRVLPVRRLLVHHRELDRERRLLRSRRGARRSSRTTGTPTRDAS